MTLSCGDWIRVGGGPAASGLGVPHSAAGVRMERGEHEAKASDLLPRWQGGLGLNDSSGSGFSTSSG